MKLIKAWTKTIALMTVIPSIMIASIGLGLCMHLCGIEYNEEKNNEF